MVLSRGAVLQNMRLVAASLGFDLEKVSDRLMDKATREEILNIFQIPRNFFLLHLLLVT